MNKIWHWIVIHNYVKCGLRYGIDQESSGQTGDYDNKFFIKTHIFWSNWYFKLGYRLIPDNVWLTCTYNKEYYLKYLKNRRF